MNAPDLIFKATVDAFAGIHEPTGMVIREIRDVVFDGTVYLTGDEDWNNADHVEMWERFVRVNGELAALEAENPALYNAALESEGYESIDAFAQDVSEDWERGISLCESLLEATKVVS